MGMGLAQPSLSTMVASSVAEQDHGIAVSTMSTTTGIGAVFGISILTAVIGTEPSAETFRDAYLVGAGLAALGVASSCLLRRVDHNAEPGAAAGSNDTQKAGPAQSETA